MTETEGDCEKKLQDCSEQLDMLFRKTDEELALLDRRLGIDGALLDLMLAVTPLERQHLLQMPLLPAIQH